MSVGVFIELIALRVRSQGLMVCGDIPVIVYDT